jgi:hypothetical protein
MALLNIKVRDFWAFQAGLVTTQNTHAILAINTLWSHLVGPGITFKGITDATDKYSWTQFIREVVRSIMTYGYVAVELDGRIPTVIDGSLYFLVPLQELANELGTDFDNHPNHHTVFGGSHHQFVPFFRNSEIQTQYDEMQIFTFIVFSPTPAGILTSPAAQCIELHSISKTFTASCITADVMNAEAMAWETSKKSVKGSVTEDIMSDRGQNPYLTTSAADLMQDACRVNGEYVRSMQEEYHAIRAESAPARASMISSSWDSTPHATKGIHMAGIMDPSWRVPTVPDASIVAIPPRHTRPDYIAILDQLAATVSSIMMVPPAILGLHSKHASSSASDVLILQTWSYNMTLLNNIVNTICEFTCNLFNAEEYLSDPETSGKISVKLKNGEWDGGLRQSGNGAGGVPKPTGLAGQA